MRKLSITKVSNKIGDIIINITSQNGNSSLLGKDLFSLGISKLGLSYRAASNINDMMNRLMFDTGAKEYVYNADTRKVYRVAA